MFQAEQLILLAMFGAVDEQLISCTMVHVYVYVLNDNWCVGLA